MINIVSTVQKLIYKQVLWLEILVKLEPYT